VKNGKPGSKGGEFLSELNGSNVVSALG